MSASRADDTTITSTVDPAARTGGTGRARCRPAGAGPAAPGPRHRARAHARPRSGSARRRRRRNRATRSTYARCARAAIGSSSTTSTLMVTTAPSDHDRFVASLCRPPMTVTTNDRPAAHRPRPPCGRLPRRIGRRQWQPHHEPGPRPGSTPNRCRGSARPPGRPAPARGRGRRPVRGRVFVDHPAVNTDAACSVGQPRPGVGHDDPHAGPGSAGVRRRRQSLPDLHPARPVIGGPAATHIERVVQQVAEDRHQLVVGRDVRAAGSEPRRDGELDAALGGLGRLREQQRGDRRVADAVDHPSARLCAVCSSATAKVSAWSVSPSSISEITVCIRFADSCAWARSASEKRCTRSSSPVSAVHLGVVAQGDHRTDRGAAHRRPAGG